MCCVGGHAEKGELVGGRRIDDPETNYLINKSAAEYSVSKAGVIMLTQVLARELADHGIRVNAIGPGFIETPMTAGIRQNPEGVEMVMAMTPMQRFGQPSEVASTALFLASDESSYFTGQTLFPSGGISVGQPELQCRVLMHGSAGASYQYRG